MTSIRPLLAGAILLLGPAVAAQSPTAETVKSELRAFVTELNAALAARDRTALERLYADEFYFVHTIGKPIDKTAHIATSMASPPGRTLPVPSFDGVMVFGEVAILRTVDDTRFSTSIYVKRNGRWQVLHLQGTPHPSSRPAAVVPSDILSGYAGRYEQDNGLFVTITVDGDHLVLQVDGRPKLPLSAESNTRFSLPGGAGVVTFAKAADGGVTYEMQRAGANVIKGTRKP
jgi:Domain of unknown function (DUF4440)/Domain of unknown function (DUF3471)